MQDDPVRRVIEESLADPAAEPPLEVIPELPQDRNPAVALPPRERIDDRGVRNDEEAIGGGNARPEALHDAIDALARRAIASPAPQRLVSHLVVRHAVPWVPIPGGEAERMFHGENRESREERESRRESSLSQRGRDARRERSQKSGDKPKLAADEREARLDVEGTCPRDENGVDGKSNGENHQASVRERPRSTAEPRPGGREPQGDGEDPGIRTPR